MGTALFTNPHKWSPLISHWLAGIQYIHVYELSNPPSMLMYSEDAIRGCGTPYVSRLNSCISWCKYTLMLSWNSDGLRRCTPLMHKANIVFVCVCVYLTNATYRFTHSVPRGLWWPRNVDGRGAREREAHAMHLNNISLGGSQWSAGVEPGRTTN